MASGETTISGTWPCPALLLAALLAGCGGAGSGPDQAAVAAEAAQEHPTIQSAALHPVERPVAKPMDRGAARPASIRPVERPVAKPLDRSAHDGAADRS